MSKTPIFFLVLFLTMIQINSTVYAKVRSETIKYEVAGQPFEGTLSYDDNIKGKRPGVLVVHEWWGHNEYARKRARMLAEQGYVALAVDMFCYRVRKYVGVYLATLGGADALIVSGRMTGDAPDIGKVREARALSGGGHQPGAHASVRPRHVRPDRNPGHSQGQVRPRQLRVVSRGGSHGARRWPARYPGCGCSG